MAPAPIAARSYSGSQAADSDQLSSPFGVWQALDIERGSLPPENKRRTQWEHRA